MPATIFIIDGNLTEIADAEIDIKEYEKKAPNGFWPGVPELLQKYERTLQDLLTKYVRENYPRIEQEAVHGDIVEDGCSGYRMDGVYFVSQKPEFRVLRKGNSLDDYGNVPRGIYAEEFDPHHWKLGKMKQVDLTGGEQEVKSQFYWHGECALARFGPDVEKNFKEVPVKAKSLYAFEYDGKLFILDHEYGDEQKQFPGYAAMEFMEVMPIPEMGSAAYIEHLEQARAHLKWEAQAFAREVENNVIGPHSLERVKRRATEILDGLESACKRTKVEETDDEE